MTDGENTDSRWESSSGIDKRMKIACQNFRTLGITLYTINLVEGDQSLLQSCATSPDLFYDVDTASQLAPVFKEIAKRILPVRLMR
ncbi:hypothetical protein ASG43_18075 [Aureimonas sp. Leaf454]|nr:hypothetical protein ASG43_18075 [Aureimonas sp. Leaf454]